MSLAAGDLDEDGRMDLIADNGYYTASVLLGLGDGTFAAPVQYASGLETGTGWGVAVGDLDGDRHLDVVIAPSPDAFELILMPGRGDGTLDKPVAIPISRGPQALVLADLDGNGWLDIAVARWPSAGIYTATTIVLNRGGLRFDAHDLPSPDGNLNSIAVGDLDGDGWLDLAVTDWDAQTASGLGILLQ